LRNSESILTRFFDVWIRVFGLLVIFFLPLHYAFIPDQTPITELIFGDAVHGLSGAIIDQDLGANTYYSDSVSTFSLYLILILLSACLSVAAIKLIAADVRQKISEVIGMTVTYFIAYQILRYGFDKVFIGQFYEPTAFVLNSNFGQLDRDLLYWSVMGLSPGYSAFLGIVELAAATLILWSRTRTLGLVLVSGVMLNVVAINFGFDISVKMFSLLLLTLSLGLLRPFLSKLLDVFFLNKSAQVDSTLLRGIGVSPRIRILHVVICSFLVFDAIYPIVSGDVISDFNKPSPTTKAESDDAPALKKQWHWFIENVE